MFMLIIKLSGLTFVSISINIDNVIFSNFITISMNDSIKCINIFSVKSLNGMENLDYLDSKKQYEERSDHKTQNIKVALKEK